MRPVPSFSLLPVFRTSVCFPFMMHTLIQYINIHNYSILQPLLYIFFYIYIFSFFLFFPLFFSFFFHANHLSLYMYILWIRMHVSTFKNSRKITCIYTIHRHVLKFQVRLQIMINLKIMKFAHFRGKFFLIMNYMQLMKN